MSRTGLDLGLDMAFITDGEPFHGGSPEEKALGGSETALVQMARALAARGHRVTVFCRCPAPGVYRGVVYRDREDLTRAAGEERFHVLVVSRFFPALDLPMQAGLRVLWNHDILDRPSALAQRLDLVDVLLVLSRYHAQDYARRLPACTPLLFPTLNGLDLELMDSASREAIRDPDLVTYVSRPERGLKLLLEYIWPGLRRRFPRLRLALCGYVVENTPIHPQLAEEYRRIEVLVRDSPGVEVLGALPKARYYRHLASSAALLYPCVFPEISCIAALEAQALATPLVTTDGFALSETVVEPRFRVGGEPGSPEYVEAYLERAAWVLENPGEAGSLAREAALRVRERHSWTGLAAQWEELFLSRLEARRSAGGEALAAALLLRGDASLAGEVLGRGPSQVHEGPAPADPREEELLRRLAGLVSAGLPPGGRVGVASADGGRTASALASLLPEMAVEESPGPGAAPWDALLIRDRLEREEDPAAYLKQMLEYCRPEGRIVLAVASGAWPLVQAGHLARRHDLGKRELESLLPERPLTLEFHPRALVGQGAGRMFAGRWLAAAPVRGGAPRLPGSCRRVMTARPVPAEVLKEVKHAGIL